MWRVQSSIDYLLSKHLLVIFYTILVKSHTFLGNFDEKAFIFQTCVFEQILATFSILAIVFITLKL